MTEVSGEPTEAELDEAESLLAEVPLGEVLELLRRTRKQKRGPDGRFLSADCEKACQHGCAYPGQFSECEEVS